MSECYVFVSAGIPSVGLISEGVVVDILWMGKTHVFISLWSNEYFV